MSQPPTPPSGGDGETRQVQLPKVPPPPPPQLQKQPPAAQPEPAPTDPGRPAPYGGPPAYGPPTYGQSPYGQPQWGQQPYGQPPFGQQQWGQPAAPPPPRKGNRGTIIALVVAGVVVLAGMGVGLWFAFGRDSGPATASDQFPIPTATAAGPTTPSSAGEPTTGSSAAEETTDSGGSGSGQGVPSAGKPPTGLGDDDALNLFAQQCYQGSMPACDVLYFAAQSDPSLRHYAAYAHTCAGRQPASSDRLCTEAFPG